MYPVKATPLIVCGRQRAGTRYVTNVFNAFPEVSIQGEIPDRVLRSVVTFMSELDTYYLQERSSSGGNLDPKKTWLRKRKDLLYAIWADSSQSKRVRAGDRCRYYGYKRPGHEKHYEFYERILEGSNPIYVYCLRNFRENYLSIASRWPERKISEVAEDYLKSIAICKRMRSAVGERLLLFNLDEHSRHGFGYLERAILEPLGLQADTELRDKVSSMGPANTTERHHGIPRRRELTDAEKQYVARHPELEATYVELVGFDRSLGPLEPSR